MDQRRQPLDGEILRSGGEGGIRTPDTVARMPHFECGAFNRSATSPAPETGQPPIGRPLSNQAYQDKQGSHRLYCGVPEEAGLNIPDIMIFDRIGKELPGICWTLGLVGALTAVLYAMVSQLGLSHGSVVYLMPVVIAATRWGIVPALVAA